MALRTTTGEGVQTTTGTPQSVGASRNTNPLTPANSSEVQPGTASNVLSGKGGISLSGQPLTVVSLGTTATGTSTQTSAQATTDQQINPAGIGLAVLLFVIAIVFFWLTSRSAKNTT